MPKDLKRSLTIAGHRTSLSLEPEFWQALQEAARLLFDLPERPKDRALRQMADDWSPWRAVAARLLWAYYRVATSRQGIAD